MNTLFRRLVLLISIGSLAAGCVAVPTPAKHKTRGQTFIDAAPNQIPDRTTKEKVLATFGPPTAIWDEENLWIYGWDESKGGWLIILPDGSPGYTRTWKDKISLLRFDEQDLLVASQTIDRPELSETGQYLVEWVRGKDSGKSESLAGDRKKVPVLMRLVTNTDGMLDDEPLEKWFDSMYQGILVRFGGFSTGGLIRERDLKKKEKIERNLWYEGWQLYYVEPGDLYLALFHTSKAFPSPSGYVEPELSMPPVIHVEVPSIDIPVYIGSFHFDRRTIIEASWNRNAVYKDYRFVGIEDERDLARQVAAKIFQANSGLNTSLPYVHDGPSAIRFPLDLRETVEDIE